MPAPVEIHWLNDGSILTDPQPRQLRSGDWAKVDELPWQVSDLRAGRGGIRVVLLRPDPSRRSTMSRSVSRPAGHWTST